MAKLESGFFWGVVAGAAAVAIAGAMTLTCCFRTEKAGGSVAGRSGGTKKPRSNRGKARRA